MSTPEIGMHVGGRDHTTILHGLAALSERTERLDDNVLLADIKDIVDIIYERAEDYAPSPEIKLNPELQEALSALDVFRESLIKAFK